MTLVEYLTSIADAIRDKTGKTDRIKATNFVSEIESISAGAGSNDLIDKEYFYESAELEANKIYRYEKYFKRIMRYMHGYFEDLVTIFEWDGVKIEINLVDVLPEYVDHTYNWWEIPVYVVPSEPEFYVNTQTIIGEPAIWKKFNEEFANVPTKGFITSSDTPTEDGYYFIVDDIPMIIIKDEANKYNIFKEDGELIQLVPSNLQQLTVTANGTYIPENGVGGYNKITVDVKPNLTGLTITENGTYYSSVDTSPKLGGTYQFKDDLSGLDYDVFMQWEPGIGFWILGDYTKGQNVEYYPNSVASSHIFSVGVEYFWSSGSGTIRVYDGIAEKYTNIQLPGYGWWHRDSSGNITSIPCGPVMQITEDMINPYCPIETALLLFKDGLPLGGSYSVKSIPDKTALDKLSYETSSAIYSKDYDDGEDNIGLRIEVSMNGIGDVRCITMCAHRGDQSNADYIFPVFTYYFTDGPSGVLGWYRWDDATLTEYKCDAPTYQFPLLSTGNFINGASQSMFMAIFDIGGYDGFDKVEVNVPTGLDTSDATATADTILEGRIAYANGEKVLGTMLNNGAIDVTMDGIDIKSVPIAEGYTSGGVVRLNDTIDNETDKQAGLIASLIEAINDLPQAGSGGGSGEQPTLFTPTIALNSVTSELVITDENGGFVEGYNIYANNELITVLTSKTATLKDYMEHTETIDIKVQATSAMFNPSDFAVIEWKYVNVNGTAGLVYSISSNGTFATCTGIGDAIETDIVIASEYEGVPVTTIGDNAFFNCTKLTSVEIPNSVTKINSYAFYGCSSLTSVEIPNSVTKIDSYAFYECISLTSIEIPNSITEIIGTVFQDCRNLKRVDLSTHTSIPTLGSKFAFGNTDSTLQIKVPANLIDSWKSATNWSDLASKIVTEFTNEV